MPIDLEKLQDVPSLLDVLISCEDVLDTCDVYAFENWGLGEVVKGPIIGRHKVQMWLLYRHDKMPDPKFCLRLLKLGIKSEIIRTDREENTLEEAPKDADDDRRFWMVKLTFPRRLLDQAAKNELEMYADEEIDLVNDANEAADAGIDDESAYQSDEQGPETLPYDPDMA